MKIKVQRYNSNKKYTMIDNVNDFTLHFSGKFLKSDIEDEKKKPNYMFFLCDDGDDWSNNNLDYVYSNRITGTFYNGKKFILYFGLTVYILNDDGKTIEYISSPVR